MFNRSTERLIEDDKLLKIGDKKDYGTLIRYFFLQK